MTDLEVLQPPVRQRAVALTAIVGIGIVLLVFGALAVHRDDSGRGVVLLSCGALVLAWIPRQVRLRVEADDEGIVVFNGFGTWRLAWTEIDGFGWGEIHIRQRTSYGLTVRLRNGRTRRIDAFTHPRQPVEGSVIADAINRLEQLRAESTRAPARGDVR